MRGVILPFQNKKGKFNIKAIPYLLYLNTQKSIRRERKTNHFISLKCVKRATFARELIYIYAQSLFLGLTEIIYKDLFTVLCVVLEACSASRISLQFEAQAKNTCPCALIQLLKREQKVRYWGGHFCYANNSFFQIEETHDTNWSIHKGWTTLE